MNGTASVAFTVTNTSAHAVDGTVMLVPEPPAAHEWFAFEGPATRNYQPGGVEQVVAIITPTPLTPAGTYYFRVDAFLEANPEEDYTEGPGKAFTVTESVAPPPWWRQYWWIGAIAAIVVIGILLTVVLAGRNDDSASIPERNCTTYDPASVNATQAGLFFNVNASGERLATGATKDDADSKVTLAKAHTKRCQFGSGAASTEYWLGAGGGPRPPRTDCTAYDPQALKIDEQGATSFVLTDGKTSLKTMANRQDADDVLALGQAFSSRCFIGRGKKVFVRRVDIVTEYWE